MERSVKELSRYRLERAREMLDAAKLPIIFYYRNQKEDLYAP